MILKHVITIESKRIDFSLMQRSPSPLRRSMHPLGLVYGIFPDHLNKFEAADPDGKHYVQSDSLAPGLLVEPSPA